MLNLFGMDATSQILVGLFIGVVALIVMVTMTKIHAFLALILSAIIVAVVGGLPFSIIPNTVADGFGGTLRSIGIIIGFGVIMGQIFEVSGAAEKMAKTFIKILGKGREDIALAITGFIVSIPVFCDSAFVILFPIAKSISEKTRKNIIVLGGALAMGLVVTHTMVPPTPGPLAVGTSFGVSVGSLILWGLVVAVPMTIAGILYIKFVGKNLIIVPNEEGKLVKVEANGKTYANFSVNDIEDERQLPSTFMSFAPIIFPILLILAAQIGQTIYNNAYAVEIAAAKVAKVAYAYPLWYDVLGFFGNPIVAVAIGVLISIYGLARKVDRKTVLDHMDDGIRSAGIILLVTGAGGALGKVIQVSGVDKIIANQIVDWGIPVILLPFVVATIVRFIQGSGTVALITSAQVTSGIVLATDTSPVFAALATMVGGVFFSYFNDSYFNVVNRSLNNKDAKDQLRFWSGATTAAWFAGIVTVLILNAVLGSVVR